MLNTHDLLRQDEDLLRLLYYDPTNYTTQPHPLSDELPNVLDPQVGELDADGDKNDEYWARIWNIIDKHILLISKADDMENNRLCRLYVYAGKTRPTYGNVSAALANQEIIIDVFVHTSYNIDSRMDEINDRLNQLLVGASGIGMGKVDIYGGYEFSAPKEYTAYRNIYEIARTRK